MIPVFAAVLLTAFLAGCGGGGDGGGGNGAFATVSQDIAKPDANFSKGKKRPRPLASPMHPCARPRSMATRS
jgi:hypothetical protein